MATNYIQPGEVIAYLASAAILSGDVVAVGKYGLGVALTDIADTETGSVELEGVFQFDKPTGAITQGDKIWWNTTDKTATNSPGLNDYFLGFATESQVSGDTTVNVLLEDFCCEGSRVLTLEATGTQTVKAADLMGGDLVLLVPNTAAKIINLPAVATIPTGAKLTVIKTDAAAFAITLDPSGSQQINGGSTFTSLDANNDRAKFINNGTSWTLIDSAIA